MHRRASPLRPGRECCHKGCSFTPTSTIPHLTLLDMNCLRSCFAINGCCCDASCSAAAALGAARLRLLPPALLLLTCWRFSPVPLLLEYRNSSTGEPMCAAGLFLLLPAAAAAAGVEEGPGVLTAKGLAAAAAAAVASACSVFRFLAFVFPPAVHVCVVVKQTARQTAAARTGVLPHLCCAQCLAAAHGRWPAFVCGAGLSQDRNHRTCS
jgi:hypothetical protein